MPSGEVLASGAGPKLLGELGRGVRFDASVGVGVEGWEAADDEERGAGGEDKDEGFGVIAEDNAIGDEGTAVEGLAEEDSGKVGEDVIRGSEVEDSVLVGESEADEGGVVGSESVLECVEEGGGGRLG